MNIRAVISTVFYAVMLSQLPSAQSTLPWRSPRFGRIVSIVNFVNKIIPGIASDLSHWMCRKNYFPWVLTDMQLIDFGSAAAVFKLNWESGVKVLRIYKKALGKSPRELLEMAEYHKNNYKRLLHWYSGPIDLVLPMEFLVLQGLPLIGPVAGSLQPYVQTEKKDIFKDFADTDFVNLMKANLFMRDQFIFFAEQTIRQWNEREICYDFFGRENLVLVKKGGEYHLKIVDIGFFEFDRPEHKWNIAQMEQHIQRLTHLYQLAKVVN